MNTKNCIKNENIVIMPNSYLTSDFEKKNILETERERKLLHNEDQMSDVTEEDAVIFNVNASVDFETKTKFDQMSSIENEALLVNEEEKMTYSVKKEILNCNEGKSMKIHEDQISASEFEKKLYYDLWKGTELNSLDVSDTESESDYDHSASIDSDELSDVEEEERYKLDCQEERGNSDNESLTDSEEVINKELRVKKNKSTRSENATLPSNLQVNENDKLRTYNCCMCSKQFKLKHHLDQHILSHTYARAKLGRIHECPTCSKQFKLKHHLERHLLSHSKVKQFKCAMCDKSYVDKYDLKIHVTSHLANKDLKKQQVFTCNICNANFDRDSKLQKHIRTHDKICGICGKEFLEYRYLRYHLRVHAKLTSFSCDVCGKLFRCKASLIEHSRIHTGEKPYKCEVCDNTFSTKSNLVRHTKSHFRTYNCKKCHKEFKKREESLQHLKTCRVNYRCDKCNWDFKKVCNYKRHMKTHAKSLNSPSKDSNLTPEAECQSLETESVCINGEVISDNDEM